MEIGCCSHFHNFEHNLTEFLRRTFFPSSRGCGACHFVEIRGKKTRKILLIIGYLTQIVFYAFVNTIMLKINLKLVFLCLN